MNQGVNHLNTPSLEFRVETTVIQSIIFFSDAPVSSRSLVTLGVNRRHEILYNLGIQLLFCGRPGVAFDCLLKAVRVYHTNPRLWLRLAECCIVSFQLVSRRMVAFCRDYSTKEAWGVSANSKEKFTFFSVHIGMSKLQITE